MIITYILLHLLICLSKPIQPSSALLLHRLPCSADDLAPLHAFHDSLPQNRDLLLPWPRNNASCCLWPGVSCNSHARVISLHLPSLNLASPFPSQLLLLPHLHTLNLSNTGLHGILPAIRTANMSSLSILDISHNPLLDGLFPSMLPSSLTYLDLSHCSLYGPIPSSISNSSKLAHLRIHHNFFSGFDAGISDLAHLQTLDASANLFIGSAVIRKLSNLTHLHTLNFDDNHIGDMIPSEIGNLGNLRILRLQRNYLVGSIPSEMVKCKKLEELRLDNNFLQGIIPELIWELPWMTVLALSNNRLEGNLPLSFPESSMLCNLSLSGNMLSGEIPVALARLPHLEVLLLSRNRFSGVLPSRFRSLKQLDVSGNKLENPWIGENPDIRFDRHTDLPHIRRQLTSVGGKSKTILIGIVSCVAAFFSILIIGAVILIICRYKRKPRNRSRSVGPSVVVPRTLRNARIRRESSTIFDPSLSSISLGDLVKATDGFNTNRIVGDGGFGYVYSAILSNGRTVAVKKFDHASGIQGEREFEAEMQTVGKIRHPNLVELIAYCSVDNERLLVYEFAENGSLDGLLHEDTGRSSELNWNLRIQIAHGTARGLAYLHHECDPHVLHRDIKSSNILLGKNFEPKIADFGFARNISICRSHVTTAGAGTLGYMAPEFCSNPIATRQADVYSFGMLLLELATGRRPNEPIPDTKFRTLTTWALDMIESGSEMELLDPVLLNGPPPSHADVTAYFILACECTSETPHNRPRMTKVYERLSLLLQENI